MRDVESSTVESLLSASQSLFFAQSKEKLRITGSAGRGKYSLRSRVYGKCMGQLTTPHTTSPMSHKELQIVTSSFLKPSKKDFFKSKPS